MGIVLFNPLPEAGHIIPTLQVARELREQGHEVIYLVEPDAMTWARSEGFRCEPYLAELRPEGAELEQHNRSAQVRDDKLSRQFHAMWEALKSKKLADQVRSLKPDVIVGDLCRFSTSFVARDVGVPYVRCSTSLPAHFEVGRAPLWSDALPHELSIQELDALWNLEITLNDWYTVRDPRSFSSREFWLVASDCGIQLPDVEHRVSFTPLIVKSDPELILCSNAFDFPTNPNPRRVFAGPCLDACSDEPWSYASRRPSAPLVYLSFGSQAVGYVGVGTFLPKFLAAMKERPHLDVVVASPDEAFENLEIPSNVFTTNWVPQRALLKSANVFVTHGGLGSVKEAVWEAVPLLAVPQAFDQHGNAARIEYHGLGKRFRATDEPSVKAIGDAIDELMQDTRYAEAATKMQGIFHAEAKEQAASRFLTSIVHDELELPPAEDYRLAFDSMRRAMFGRD